MSKQCKVLDPRDGFLLCSSFALYVKQTLISMTNVLVSLCRVSTCEALPGVLGIQGEGPFIFRELGSTSKYFKGSGEQAKI